MERHGHDTVGGVEGLLYSVTVVDVDINVQNSLMVPDKISSKQNIYIKPKSKRILHSSARERLKRTNSIRKTESETRNLNKFFNTLGAKKYEQSRLQKLQPAFFAILVL